MNADTNPKVTDSSSGQPGELIPEDWEVPAIFRQRLGDQVGRQRPMIADGHLLLVLHQPPRHDQNERRPAIFWRNPAGEWRASGDESGGTALESHFAEYHSRLLELDEQEVDARKAEELFTILSEVTPLHRSARHQHAALQEARDQIKEARDLIYFRDRTYEIERAAELLYTDAKNALDFSIARRAEEQAQSSYQMAVSSHRLNVLAAFFFPIATLSAMFGINMQHGFETEWAPQPFLVTMIGGLLIGFVLMLVVIRSPPERRT